MEDMTTAQAVAAIVQALHALAEPKWTDIVQAVSVPVVGLTQCVLIYFGLRQMGKASEDRNRQLDQHGRQLDQHGRQLDQQGEALAAAVAGIQALLKERDRDGKG